MFLLLGFYPTVLEHFYPEYGKRIQAERALAAKGQPVKGRTATAAQTAPAAATGNYEDGGNVLFKNDKLRLVFNRKGGAVREIAFLDFLDDRRKEPLKFVSAQTPAGAPFSVAVISPAPAGQEEDCQIGLEGKTVVVTSTILDGRVRMTRRFVPQGSGYLANYEVSFQNVSAAPVDLQYELFAGSRIHPRETIDTQYIETNFFGTRDGKKRLRHVREGGAGKTVASEGSLEWLAVKDRHFSVILKPSEAGKFSGIVRGLGNHQFSGSLVSPVVSLAPGAVTRENFTAYIGPNDLDTLEPAGLGDIVNFGKMDLIGKFFIGGLEMLHGVFKNYGVSIIALTLLINLFLFPLTRQSFMSMKRMQIIQPQMNKLRDQYKDNPTRLNKEMMELYKKHKVNPLGGCLPMLLQMPIFIALYVAISKFVKLIGADFLWVQDLSSPDVVRLPFALPFLGGEIHVLPLIMLVGMMVQQRLSAANMQSSDPAMVQQQKMMAWMMPVIFGFIFYSMPAALVLYWLTNTALMTSYQLYLKRVNIAS